MNDAVILINSPLDIRESKNRIIRIDGDEFSNMPMSVLYLAANLRKHGHETIILDPTPMQLSIEDIVEIISDVKPILVGISAMTPSIRTATTIATKIKEVFGNSIPICLGGAHANVDPTFIERFPCFDFTIIGESEITLVDMVEEILGGGRPVGIIYAKPANNLDDLPPPARDLLNPNHYHRPETRSKKSPPAATILATRGCPFGCIFCSRPVHQKCHRIRSPQSVVDEMESIAESYNNHFSFMDDALTLNHKNIIGICDEIIHRGLKFRWIGSTRASSFDEELASKMVEAGCYDLFFGVESGNERIRNEVVHKNVSNTQIFNAIKIARKNNIHTNIFMMLGFPSETMTDVEDTVNFGPRCGADLMGIKLTLPLPGSELYSYAIKQRKIPIDLIDRFVKGELGETFIGNWPQFIPDGLTLEYLIEAKKRAYRKFYINPKWVLRRAWNDLMMPSRLRGGWELLKIAPHAFKFGKTKTTWA